MSLFIELFGYSLLWQVGAYDPMQNRYILARLQLRKGFRAWWGWLYLWEEKPNWKEFPTNAALRVEHTSNFKTIAYVFRGPIERILVN